MILTNSMFNKDLREDVITRIIIDLSQNDYKYKYMCLADEYLKSENPEILKKTRDYYDKDGKAHTNPSAYNSIMCNGFLSLLIRQKQDYALSKSFNFKIYKGDKRLKHDEKYYKAWKRFINDTLLKFSYQLVGDAVNHGIAWCYVWIDENEELKLYNAHGYSIYPVWVDDMQDKLSKVVYHYKREVYNNVSSTITEYAEFWDNNKRMLFNVTDGFVDESNNKEQQYLHMNLQSTGVSWGAVPFIPLKANNEELPLLKSIKSYLDSYDQLSSKVVDGLVDDAEPLLVIKGISSQIDDLIEAREIAKMTRTISLDTDGEAKYIQVSTDINGVLLEKKDLRKDIFMFGYGVDYEDSRFTGDPNQMVVKSLYQNLDTYCDGLERQYQSFIENLKYFFDKWLEWKGEGSFEDFNENKIYIEFDRRMMINKSEMIQDAVLLQSTGISKRTLLEYNPAVQDVDLELERLKEEESKNDLFNFKDEHNDNTVAQDEEESITSMSDIKSKKEV